jgi:penicillin-binding protein A
MPDAIDMAGGVNVDIYNICVQYAEIRYTMIKQFPMDEYPLMKRKKRRYLRLRYLLLPLLLIFGFLFFMPDNKGVAEMVPVKEKKAALAKKDLTIIDQDSIKKQNLTINWGLQQFISETAVKYKLYYGAIVVMDARTGDILAMYGQKSSGQDCSICLDPNHAASIFKLVTAVAAMDQGGYNSSSVFSYTGNAHTLYKNQLKDRKDRWTANITLADAFAHSNNVVFAKIGMLHLGETPIFLTAMKLGFWKSPLKEIECTPSTIFFPQTEYNLAELSCGFNRQTKISPMHAAQMVSSVLNKGSMVTPRLVRSEEDDHIQAMSEEAARNLAFMMERTARSGTVAKAFRHVESDKVLRDLTIGGKSGSIDGDDPQGRRNWFVGYAQNRSSNEAITIGCLLIRNGYFWIEADTLSRLVMRYYFSRQLDVAQTTKRGAKPKT